MCTLYTYTNMYMPRFSRSGFFGPSRCLIPTPGLTYEYPICAVRVCACVYTHIHPHTLPPVSKIEKAQTTPLSFLLSKSPPTPSNKCSHRLVEPHHPRSPNAERTNCTCISTYAHSVASVLANVYTDVHNTRLTYTYMHGAQNTSLNACTLSAKNAYALVLARICNGAEASLP